MGAYAEQPVAQPRTGGSVTVRLDETGRPVGVSLDGPPGQSSAVWAAVLRAVSDLVSSDALT